MYSMVSGSHKALLAIIIKGIVEVDCLGMISEVILGAWKKNKNKTVAKKRTFICMPHFHFR